MELWYDQTSAGRNIGTTLKIGIQGQIYNPGTANSFSPTLGQKLQLYKKHSRKISNLLQLHHLVVLQFFLLVPICKPM